MKRIIFTVTVFLIASFQYSCKKETIIYATNADQITNQLKKVIVDNTINRVYPVRFNDVFPNSFPSQSGIFWSFSNGFVEINYGFNQAYNLLYLRYYTISQIGLDNGISAKALILYF